MVEWKRDTPWRQGQLLSAEAGKALGLQHAQGTDQTLIVVATHDCDLTQSPDGEPLIEIIIGLRMSREDGNHTHAKNPRKLHIDFTGALTVWAEFEATAKMSINKQDLAKFQPRADILLSPQNQAIFQKWLASRYRRSAFPDEFERRLTAKEFKLSEKIIKAVKPHGALISGIFFDVDEGEEVVRQEPDDPYKLDITILHPAEPDFIAAEAAAQQAAKAIQEAFRKKLFVPTQRWRHIELRFCEAVPESVLTYHHFKQLKSWRLEHISLAGDPQQAILAE